MKKIFIAVCAIVQLTLESQLIAHDEGKPMAVSSDVCDLNRIYDPAAGYAYSLPKSVLEKWLSGGGFDYRKTYTLEESSALEGDIHEIFQKILEANPIKAPLAVMTAGAPGAGKTTKMLQDLEQNRSEGRNYAYICPDDVCLKQQTRTYQFDIKRSDGSPQERQALYNKWRPGSNAATHLILGNLIREKYAFYFGTTSTGPATCYFLDFLKKQGYQIRLIHLTAPDDVRWESIKERDKTFIQTTEQDVKQKGDLLPQRITDTFLKYADTIEFYYRDAVNQDAQLAAIWTRNEPSSEKAGTLEVISSSRYERIKTIHDTFAKKLERPDLLWESAVEQRSKVMAPSA